MKAKLKTFSIRLPTELLERLKACAKQERRTQTAITYRALEEYFSRSLDLSDRV